jgi:hypothetical protein
MVYSEYMDRQLQSEPLCYSKEIKKVRRSSDLPKGYRWLYVEELEIKEVWAAALMEVHGFDEYEIDEM